MSVMDEPQVDEATEPVHRPDAGRRRRRVSVSPTVLVVLVLALPAVWLAVTGLRAISEPTVFAKYDRPGTGSSGPSRVGERTTLGFVYGPLPDVTVISARVITTDGSAAAATALSICRAAPSNDPKSIGIGAAKGDISEFCREVVPVAGKDLGDLDPRDSLITTVVPLGTGSVRITGIEISYKQDGRRGREIVEVGDAVAPVR